jgi:transcriptional regulator with XRE-family HTH domain
MKLSEKLYNLRRKQGLSQEALAERLDCSRQVISKWENGMTKPDAEMLQKYSELFCVSID